VTTAFFMAVKSEDASAYLTNYMTSQPQNTLTFLADCCEHCSELSGTI